MSDETGGGDDKATQQLLSDLLDEINLEGGLTGGAGPQEPPSSPVVGPALSAFNWLAKEVLSLRSDAEVILKHYGYEPVEFRKNPQLMPSEVGTPTDNILRLAVGCLRLAGPRGPK